MRLNPLAGSKFFSPEHRALIVGLVFSWCLGSAGFLSAQAASVDASDSTSGEAQSASKLPAVRIVKLEGPYVDHPSGAQSPLSLLAGDLSQPTSFYRLCRKLDEFAEDDGIQHILLDFSDPYFQMNLAQLSEFARHVERLRRADKRTFAWLQSGSTTHYLAANACDTILMAEMGALDLPSPSLTTLHFRDAMELIGARASVVRVGDYKGAVEPFTQSQMSRPLREHYRKMLVSMNKDIVNRIAEGRNLKPEKVRELQAQRLFTAQEARRAGLVDDLIPQAAVQQSVADRLGQKVEWIHPPKQTIKPVSFFELMSQLFGKKATGKTDVPAVAVLHLAGQIIDGENERPGFLVSGPVTEAIEELKQDDQIRAVVVRINSPGGSATASEAIRRALVQLADEKPVVISMGQLAASGGYWIACLGRPIYAEPGTITGSIGVFGLKLSFGPLLRRVGLNVESVTLDESATAMSLQRTWTPREMERVQTLVDDIYDKFLQRVAESRRMSVEAVDEIAGGRVWSGAQAAPLNLVDHLGGLDHAVAAVADDAGLTSEYDVIHRPRRKSFLETFGLLEDPAKEILGSLSPTARWTLRQSGFDLSFPLHMAQESLSGKPIRAWLLAPAQFRIW